MMTMTLNISKEDLDMALGRLQAEIDKHGSQTAFATKHGLSHSLISQIMCGRMDPPPSVLKVLGLRRVVRYEELPNAKRRRTLTPA